jgi:polyhydroxyalkanoate synthase
VLKRAFESGGLSLMRGARNFARDLVTNGGTPRQVAADVHQVGVNMALSPGKVVLRNELMELIQYAPSTGEVHEVPLLFSPPWINKYYVMDLAPGRSLVEWAVQHGHTVFMISYRNPDETMSKVRLDDYLLSGPLEALEAITDITGSEKVNLLGLCLGGTLTMATMAYLDAVGVDKINSATFLNTLIDFSEPGLMGVFTDKTTITRLEQTMKKTGFLPADNMRRSFDLMRANDLIWNYVVSSWMMGEDPPAFDLLSWNADSTRMPADMHSFYLRSCYLENQLARSEMELAGQRLDLGTVDQDLYFLAAEQDHIAPWRSSYRGALLPAGDVRFVLSNAGHIAGIVNPPNPKSIHRVVESGAALPADPEEWLASAHTHPTTWWEDWAKWITQRAGAMQGPPPMGSERFSPLADAPGEYVLER